MTDTNEGMSHEVGPLRASVDEVTFPIGKDNFVKFVTSLLGQPQKFRLRKRGVFDVDLQWLMATHHLIDQRITQQNEGQLISFRAEVFFNDGRSQVLNSIEAIETFREVHPVISHAVSMEWAYLVHFPHKKAPEKQTIELFISDGEANVHTPNEGLHIVIGGGGRGYIFVEIDFTERTWGEDMQTLIKGHIDTKFKNVGRKREWLTKYNIIIIPVILLLGYFVPAVVQELKDKEVSESAIDFVRGMNQHTASLTSISQKLDFMIIFGKVNYGVLAEMFPFIVFFLAIVASVCLIIIANWKDPSYVVLTEKAKENRRKSQNKERRGWIILFGTFSISFVAGIIANLVFWYLVGGE